MIELCFLSDSNNAEAAMHRFGRAAGGAALFFLFYLGLSGQACLAQEALEPGEAFVTRFSGTAEAEGRTVIDTRGAVGVIVDLTAPGAAPQGASGAQTPESAVVTADQVGQVFGIALDEEANVYLSATSAFGLHRNADNSGWMEGMWGAQGGPGTVWKLDAANGYAAEAFAEITAGGRANTGASLGNIAYDRFNRQLFVSDLETGLIHRLGLQDGADLGSFDHGTQGRTGFFDVPASNFATLDEVPFDPAAAARTEDCPSGDFARDPACWNVADFRRRVFGLGVRRDDRTGEVRLYYSLWSSQGFGAADFAGAPDEEKRNSIWSIALTQEGDFDTGSVRREFFLPDFFRSPAAIARAGFSHPVTDIAFPAFGEQDVMLLAERGGLRNRGLEAENSFAFPQEARVLRYELTELRAWRPAGRYDVGFYDRGEAGPPYLRASAAGGVTFASGYDENGEIAPAAPDAFVWMSGDGLCSPQGPCRDPQSGAHSDDAVVDGIQGRAARPYEAFEPMSAFDPYPAPGPVTPPTGPDGSYMVAVAGEETTGGEAPVGGGATRVGDVEAFQVPPPEPAGEDLGPMAEEPGAAGEPGAVAEEGFVPGAAGEREGFAELPPEGWFPAPPPDDGWFDPPPFPLDTDLAIAKTGPAQCQEGVACSYEITVTNVGAASYTGPVAIRDEMPAGASFAEASPGWHCTTAAGAVSCVTNAFALLDPGAHARLTLTVLLPPDVPGPDVRNCARIDWPEMGTDDGPGDGNDEACIDTPVADGFDLGIVKNGPVDCAAGSTCRFEVSLANWGPGDFTGPLVLRDTLPAGTTLEVAADLYGTMSCVPIGGDVIRCETPETTLPAGAMFPMIVDIRLPPGNVGGTYQNCAEIDWAGIGADDGAADVHADSDCHTVNVIDGAAFHDLRITKSGPTHCDAGGLCSYEITVVNDGPGDYTGEIALQDQPILAGVTYDSASPGWGCGAAVPVNCTLLGGPHTLHPGDSRNLTLTLRLPDPPPDDTLINCVEYRWSAPGMPPDDAPPPGATDLPDRACAATPIGAGFDLEISKVALSPECTEGGRCDFEVTVTSNGPGNFFGVVPISDTWAEGSALESLSGAPFCASGGPRTVTCSPFASLPALGPLATASVGTRLADPFPADRAENCAVIDWGAPVAAWLPLPVYAGDDNPANDGPVCASSEILAADLAPFGATVCELGATCDLDVEIENRGGKLFRGRAGLEGSLDPAVAIASVEGVSAGLACRVAGSGRYECEAETLELKPGEAARLRLSIEIPADFPHRRIVHRKEMLWPDASVKDKMPENDRHVSTIWINQPPEEEPAREEPVPQEAAPEPEEPEAMPQQPPAQSVAAPDLSIEKTADEESCAAGQGCGFALRITNVGEGAFAGPLQISDVSTPAARRLGDAAPSAWSCRGSRGRYSCSHPGTTLAPGDSLALTFDLALAASASGTMENCATLEWPRRARVMMVQRALNELGLDAGPVDGRAGPRTFGAVRAYQELAGLSASGEIDATLLDRLFGGWGEGDGDASNDRACVSVRLTAAEIPPVAAPRPECAPGWRQVDPETARSIAARGGPVRRVSGGGRTIFCTRAAPPPQPQASCPSGWREVSAAESRRLGQQGWQIRRIDGLFCARRGEVRPRPTPQPQPQTRPRPQPQPEARPQCPRGWQQVDRRRAGTLRQQGWRIRQVGDLLCAQRPAVRPAPPPCTGGRVRNRQGRCVCPRERPVWTGRSCEPRPRPQPETRPRPQPQPQAACPRGWRPVDRARAKALVQQGWRIRQVGQTLCARRPAQQTRPQQTRPQQTRPQPQTRPQRQPAPGQIQPLQVLPPALLMPRAPAPQ